jgi:hypothetical protein
VADITQLSVRFQSLQSEPIGSISVAAAGTATRLASAQAQHQSQSVVHRSDFVEGELSHLIADAARVGGADHLAEHARYN